MIGILDVGLEGAAAPATFDGVPALNEAVDEADRATFSRRLSLASVLTQLSRCRFNGYVVVERKDREVFPRSGRRWNQARNSRKRGRYRAPARSTSIEL